MAPDLADLEKSLWDAADELRANSGLKASEYGTPVMGLIFLRFAEATFVAARDGIEAKASARRTIGPQDYEAAGVIYLDDAARFGLNWLTTHLGEALRRVDVMRTRIRIERIDGHDVCRVDIARSSSPISATMSDKRTMFWVRMSNSTRALPEVEIEDYVRDRWRGARQ